MSSHTVETLRNGLKVLSGQVGINLFSLGFGIYFAHVLELKEMAVVAVLILIGNLFPVATSLGMNDSLIKKVPGFIEQGRLEEAKKYFVSTLLIQMMTTGILVCLCLVFYDQVAQFFYKSVLPFSTMAIIVGYACMRSMLLLMNSMARAVQYFGRLTTAKVLEQVSGRIISIALFFIWHVNGLLAGMVIGSVIALLFYGYFLIEFMRHAKPSFRLAKEIVHYSFPYYGAAWLRFSIMQADRYFVIIFFQPEQLAVYHIANKIIENVTQIIDALASPITSKLAQLKVYGTARIESIFKKIFKYYALLYIPLISVIIAFARPCIELYGGAKYAHGFQILVILSFGLMLAPFSGMIETFVFVIGKPAERFKIRLYSGIFSIAGAYMLMQMSGINGLALSKLFIWGIYIVVGVVLLRKYMKVSIEMKVFFNISIYFIPMILFGLFIQIYYYHYVAVAAYFVLFNVLLFFFALKTLKGEPELGSLLPGRLRMTKQAEKQGESS